MLLAGAAACGTPEPGLVPAPGVERTPGPGVGGAVRRARITVEARARAWSAEPADLHTRVTPLLVAVSNGSTRPLRIRYDAFALVTARGPSLAAIPPYHVGDRSRSSTREATESSRRSPRSPARYSANSSVAYAVMPSANDQNRLCRSSGSSSFNTFRITPPAMKAMSTAIARSDSSAA